MTRICLIRHGAVEASPDGKRYLGVTEVPLSATGQKEAASLGEWLGSVFSGEKTEIFSSPLGRCRNTAKILSERMASGGRIPAVQVVPDLHEIDLGRWENRRIEDVRREDPKAYEIRGENLWNYRTEGGESFEEAGMRFRQALNRILTKRCSRAADDSKPETFIIVSHAGVIRSYLALLGFGSTDQLLEVPMPYAGVTILEEKEDRSFEIRMEGYRPLRLLDDPAVEKLYEKYRVPEPVRMHMRAVADMAAELTDRFLAGKKMLEKIPDAGGDPAVCFLWKRESGKMNGIIHPERIRKACLLHDLLRTQPHHAEASAKAVRKEGYPDLAEIIRVHHVSDWTKQDEEEPVTDAEIVFYADKLVQGDRRVSAEERFEASLQKCKSQEALAHHDAMYRKTLAIGRKLGLNCPGQFNRCIR